MNTEAQLLFGMITNSEVCVPVVHTETSLYTHRHKRTKCSGSRRKQAFLLPVLPAVVLLFVINGFTLSPVRLLKSALVWNAKPAKCAATRRILVIAKLCYQGPALVRVRADVHVRWLMCVRVSGHGCRKCEWLRVLLRSCTLVSTYVTYSPGTCVCTAFNSLIQCWVIKRCRCI